MAPPSKRDGFMQGMNSTYELYVKQYPHQSSNGRRELRATESPKERRPSISTSLRDRGGKAGNGDTAKHGAGANGPGMNSTQDEDFQDRYNSRRRVTQSMQSDATMHRSKSIHSVDSTEGADNPGFGGVNDGADRFLGIEPGKRSIHHIPARTSSSAVKSQNRLAPQTYQPQGPQYSRSVATCTHVSASPSPSIVDDSAYDPSAHSSGGSIFSQESTATSVHTLPPLQTKGPDNSDVQQLEPVIEDDPASWDLVAPLQDDHEVGTYALERRADQLMGSEHLRTIFDDPKLLLRFTGFLNSHRPQSIPILIYYLDALKALRAINYANAIAEALEPITGQSFTEKGVKLTSNPELEEKASRAFDVLVAEDLPAYIAHTWIQLVSVSVQRRITGTLAPHLREASEGLAETFCMTDPTRPDNPIVFASEEFTRTTQYGMTYVIGRNCRFLQGPRTNRHAVRRLAMASTLGKEHNEVLLNYRRDGSPFLNLLMTAPLMDSRGNVRYFIGAQIDVSGLAKECADMEGLARLIEKEQAARNGDDEEESNHKDEFQELGEMFNGAELETVRRFGGRMHKEYVDDSDRESISNGRPRLLLKDPTQDLFDKEKFGTSESAATSTKDRLNGRLGGVYRHYLLVRPAPSLRILFTSPSLRVPGILQTPFLNRVGGSSRVRADLGAALADGRGVTAKIRWLAKPDEDGEGEGRARWIHCTPLLGHTGAVGVWMVVLVDEEGSAPMPSGTKRYRMAPTISNTIGAKEWDSSQSKDRLNAYSKDQGRRGAFHLEHSHVPRSRAPSTSNGTVMSSPRQEPRPEALILTSASVSEFSFNLGNN